MIRNWRLRVWLINTQTKKTDKASQSSQIKAEDHRHSGIIFFFRLFGVGVILTILVRVGANTEQRHATWRA